MKFLASPEILENWLKLLKALGKFENSWKGLEILESFDFFFFWKVFRDFLEVLEASYSDLSPFSL